MTSSVGSILREERQRQGRELGTIANALCITRRYLDAIERDDLKSLPGVFFYRSFVKQYAEILEMDEAALAAPMEALLPLEEELPLPGANARYGVSPDPVRLRDPRSGDPIIIESNKRMLADRRVAIPAVALLIALVSGGIVFERWSQTRDSVAATAAVKTAANKPVAAATKMRESPVVSVADPGSPGQAAFLTAANGDPLDRVEIRVAATEKVWISITSDGKQIFSGVLEPSESKTLSGREFAKVSVGNAGGLDIRWNGKQIGPIGKRGQVRTLRFTKDNYEILPPANGHTL